MGAKHRVLILSASAGTGHLRAADALEKACHRRQEISDVAHVDALNYTNKIFRDFYSKFYTGLVKSAPTFLGWWYETSDEPWSTDRMRFMLDRMNTGPLVKLIQKLNPDITICTHFLPAEIISHLIQKKKIQAKLSIVVTDFDFHSMWLSRAFHHYFVALDETKVHLEMLGLPGAHVTVSGIPVDPRFAEKKEKALMRENYGLAGDKPVILVSGGALGVGPAEHVVRVLKHLKQAVQIVVICGKNEVLRQKVADQAARDVPSHLTFKILGFTDAMHDWMSAADLYVGKPGGLTTAEALAKGLPMVIFAPIPGQEERNSDHLLEKGVAIKCNEFTTMAYKIDQLFAEEGRLARMSQAARKLGRPDAAQTVVDTLLGQFDIEPHEVRKEEEAGMAERAIKP
jgi:processive 1,2-diacylglycerol beta-glucosyltransferase